MKKPIIILLAFALLMSCKVKDLEDGYAKIYFTKISEGSITLSPDNVTIDKENKTMNFSFGVYRSGNQPAEAFTVDLFVDNTNIPAGTIALTDYKLTTSDGENAEKINIQAGKVQTMLNLRVPQAVFEANLNQTMALRINLANPTKYELNEELSATNILINVSDFIGSYMDVTDKLIKNARTPFEVTPDSPPKGTDNPCHQTPTDWIVNDAVKIHQFSVNNQYYGGVDARVWGDRDWLGVSNWDNAKAISNGKIYQTAKLTSGEYLFEYEVGESAGGTNQAYFVIAEGSTLPDFNEVTTNSISYIDFTQSPFSINLVISDEKTASIGFVYDIPAQGGKYAYFVRNIYIKKKTNVFAE